MQIIYIEDSPDDVGLAELALKKAGLNFKMFVVDTEKEFSKVLDVIIPDLILSDHSLPGFNSSEAYKITMLKRPDTPFILFTGTVSEEFAVNCLLAGIDDYILKSNLIRLPSSIERVLAKKKIKQEKEIIEGLHAELKETYRQIEIKNKETVDSINYAKRIQDAVLPNDKQFENEFNSGFIINQPRDIVSGDLFWLSAFPAKDENSLPLKVIAAIDCTGHGIPGAFMSLLVSVLLNETLKNRTIKLPGDVLFHLNQKLPAILYGTEKEKINDGLDIVLCAIDLTKKVVYYSGANRPLWIVRKTNEGFEVIIFKATKASIGGFTLPDQEFINTTFALETGDRLFMFTDGITDQFGGHKGKKMGRKKLKEILVNSAGFEIDHQKKYIFAFIKEWQGANEQVDDMLMVGIEIN